MQHANASYPLLAIAAVFCWGLACSGWMTPPCEDFRDMESFPGTCRCEGDDLEDPDPPDGTNRYHELSSICGAAVHAGVLTERGTVEVHAYGDCPVFVGSSRHGVYSDNNTIAQASYGFTAEPLPCDDPFDIPPLQPKALPDDANCDDEVLVNKVCGLADGYDFPSRLEAISGVRFDCPCEQVAVSNALVRSLFPSGYKPRKKLFRYSSYPVLNAARSQNDNILRFLLEHGADPNPPDAERSALQLAIQSEPFEFPRLNAVVMLVRAGADTKDLDWSKCDAAHPVLGCEALKTWVEANATR